MHPILLRTVALPLALVAVTAIPAFAQASPESVQQWLDDCRDRERNGWNDDRAQHCEVRELAVARGTRMLRVDGETNGGVRFTGWDRDSIAVFALVQTQDRTEEGARDLASRLRISTANGRVGLADAPSREGRAGYSVSYRIFVPRRMDLEARTHNGGISVTGVTGRMDLAAHNGGLSVSAAGGELRGRTTNGGITLTLAGTRWDGSGVDLQTQNGGVTVTMPAGYNARLETSTVNGGFNIDFPVTVQGRIGRQLTTTIGDGGPLVRAVTTNGGVRIRRS